MRWATTWCFSVTEECDGYRRPHSESSTLAAAALSELHLCLRRMLSGTVWSVGHPRFCPQPNIQSDGCAYAGGAYTATEEMVLCGHAEPLKSDHRLLCRLQQHQGFELDSSCNRSEAARGKLWELQHQIDEL